MESRLKGITAILIVFAVLGYIRVNYFSKLGIEPLTVGLTFVGGVDNRTRASNFETRAAQFATTRVKRSIDGIVTPLTISSQNAIALQPVMPLTQHADVPHQPAAIILCENFDGLSLLAANIDVPVLILNTESFDKLLERYDGALATAWVQQDVDTVELHLVASILATVALVVSILALHLYFRGTIPERSSNMVVLTLPTHMYHYGDWQETCVICLEEFDPSSLIMTLPCGHEFHSSCVSIWLLRHRNICPLCLKKVTEESMRLMV